MAIRALTTSAIGSIPKPKNITQFSDPLLGKIFSFVFDILKPGEFFQISKTCTVLRNAANSEAFWRPIAMDRLGGKLFPKGEKESYKAFAIRILKAPDAKNSILTSIDALFVDEREGGVAKLRKKLADGIEDYFKNMRPPSLNPSEPRQKYYVYGHQILRNNRLNAPHLSLEINRFELVRALTLRVASELIHNRVDTDKKRSACRSFALPHMFKLNLDVREERRWMHTFSLVKVLSLNLFVSFHQQLQAIFSSCEKACSTRGQLISHATSMINERIEDTEDYGFFLYIRDYSLIPELFCRIPATHKDGEMLAWNRLCMRERILESETAFLLDCFKEESIYIILDYIAEREDYTEIDLKQQQIPEVRRKAYPYLLQIFGISLKGKGIMLGDLPAS